MDTCLWCVEYLLGKRCRYGLIFSLTSIFDLACFRCVDDVWPSLAECYAIVGPRNCRVQEGPSRHYRRRQQHAETGRRSEAKPAASEGRTEDQPEKGCGMPDGLAGSSSSVLPRWAAIWIMAFAPALQGVEPTAFKIVATAKSAKGSHSLQASSGTGS